jgi:hypothetical protein
MGSIIGRRDYERFLILSKRDREMLSEDEQAELIEAEYSKPTELAALELRARGIDANASTLDYLIKKQAVPAPSGGTGRNRRWTPADIDRAADYLEDQNQLVPGAVTRMYLGVDAGQDLRAREAAFDANPDLPRDTDMFVLEVVPGALGIGVPNRVRYRRMTTEEEGERLARIEEARAHGDRGER